jgi:hypothetical protein
MSNHLRASIIGKQYLISPANKRKAIFTLLPVDEVHDAPDGAQAHEVNVFVRLNATKPAHCTASGIRRNGPSRSFDRSPQTHGRRTSPGCQSSAATIQSSAAAAAEAALMVAAPLGHFEHVGEEKEREVRTLALQFVRSAQFDDISSALEAVKKLPNVATHFLQTNIVGVTCRIVSV